MDGNSFPEFILGWTIGEKAAEGRRSPRPGGNSERPGEREAFWSAPALWRFGTRQLPIRMCSGNGTDLSRRNTDVAARRQSAANCPGIHKWRLSPESRYAEGGWGAPANGTDWSRRLVTVKLCEDGNLMKADWSRRSAAKADGRRPG